MTTLPTWPLPRMGEAIGVLAHHAGYLRQSAPSMPLPAVLAGADASTIARFVERRAEALGLEADAVDVPIPDAESFVRRCAPALLRVPGEPASYLAVLGASTRRVRVVGPDHMPHTLALRDVVHALTAGESAAFEDEVERTLERADFHGRARARARTALLRECMRDRWLRGSFVLEVPASAPLPELLRRAGAPRLLARVLAVHAIGYAAMLLSWWMVGRAALSGRVELGWLAAWALLLLSLVPLRSLSTWWQGRVALEIGGLLKRRALAGALRLEPEEIRHQGAGELLGRIVEAEAIERLAIGGGLDALVALVELSFAAAVLALGAAGPWHASVLAIWLAATAMLTALYYRRRGAWSRTRIAMTNDLVEHMVGHRTRLAQEAPDRWHDAEDQSLALYHASSRALDRGATSLLALVPRGWLLVGLVPVLPTFVATGDAASTAAALAISIGGLVLSSRALGRLAYGVHDLVGAHVAWHEVSPLFAAASRPREVGTPELMLEPAQGGDVILAATDLGYGYAGRGRTVLAHCDLNIAFGDRVLLQGESGGGKSTLAALVSGLRTPDTGLVLLRGIDRKTLGAAEWARRVAAAPQFHDNHVMTETLGFNLLMGRGWPASPSDLAEAESVCRALGLGELLGRMPSGMMQMVGDTGWQLSHGERSRIFIARALLQDPDLVVLDESFAALDPMNLRKATSCVLERARSVLVIAHP